MSLSLMPRSQCNNADNRAVEPSLSSRDPWTDTAASILESLAFLLPSHECLISFAVPSSSKASASPHTPLEATVIESSSTT